MPVEVSWPAVIKAVAPTARTSVIAGLATSMPLLIERFDISTPLRQAHFLGQTAHESDGFRVTAEYASGAAYEGRKDLGNTQRYDGKRFKGRGLIQNTGRANYAAASKALGFDYVANPQMLETWPHAALVSGWYWAARKLNVYADRDDILTLTRRINGGTNGLEARIAYTKRAMAALGVKRG